MTSIGHIAPLTLVVLLWTASCVAAVRLGKRRVRPQMPTRRYARGLMQRPDRCGAPPPSGAR